MKVRLLLSTQRSGSHFLKSLIETRFPGVACSGEILRKPDALAFKYPVLGDHPQTPYFWTWYETEVAAGRVSVAPDKRLEAFEGYLAYLSALAAPRDLVLDIKYNSIRSLGGYWDTEYGSQDFTSFITQREIPVLHLIRRNILRVIISNKLATQTGVWHRTGGQFSLEALPKIRLNPKNVLFEIRYSLKLTQDYQNRFSGYSRYEEIVYEDFVREYHAPLPGEQTRVLTRFLVRNPEQAQPGSITLKKTTPEDPSEVVENWDEMVRVLRATEYGWMAQTPLLAAA